MRRCLQAVGTVALVAAVVVGALAPPVAAGGGSWLEPDREWYRPGDVVHLAGNVRKLDRDWHGPYTVTLHPSSDEVPVVDGGIPVGRLVVARLDDQTVRAEVTFVLPKLPDGHWRVSSCSPGCAHALGDLTGGWLVVGEPPPPLPPTTATPPAPAAAPATAPTTAVQPEPAVAPTSVVPTSAVVAPAGKATRPEPAAGDPGVDRATDPGGAAGPGPVVQATGEPPARASAWWLLAGLLPVAALAAWRLRASAPRRVVTSGGDEARRVEVAGSPQPDLDEPGAAGGSRGGRAGGDPAPVSIDLVAIGRDDDRVGANR